MVKNHALYKKIALATLVIAPILAELASHESPPPEPAQAVAASAAAAPAAKATPAPAIPSPLLTAANASGQFVPAGPLDPKPTLETTPYSETSAAQPAQGQGALAVPVTIAAPTPSQASSSESPATPQGPSAPPPVQFH